MELIIDESQNAIDSFDAKTVLDPFKDPQIYGIFINNSHLFLEDFI